jgi:hypothetical protein
MNIFSLNAFGTPSKGILLSLELSRFIPVSLFEFFNDHNPNPRVAALREVTNVANAVAKQLISTKANALLEGNGKKDIMSLLGKSFCLHLDPYL